MHFKSSAKLFTAILVPEVFLEIFLRERGSEPLSGDIADNELRLICQFAYVLKHVLPQFIHLLYVRSRSDPSQSIQFLERDS